MRFSILLACVALMAISFESCRKTALEGDLEPLAGEWRWVKTVGSCGSSDPNWCYYTPEIREETVTLHFEERGRFEFFEGADRVAKGRVQAEYHNPDIDITWSYVIELKPSIGSTLEEDLLRGYLQGDTLVLNAYPYALTSVKNYFLPFN